MPTELIEDRIEPGEATGCDHCRRSLDTGSEVFVDLPASKVYCSRSCWLQETQHPETCPMCGESCTTLYDDGSMCGKCLVTVVINAPLNEENQ